MLNMDDINARWQTGTTQGRRVTHPSHQGPSLLHLHVKLTQNGVRVIEYVPCPIYHRELEPESDAQKGYLGLAREFDGEHHP